MARTAIPVTVVENFQAGTNLTGTAGDATNDHNIDLSQSKRTKPLILTVRNTNVATVAFTIEMPAAASTYNETISIAHTAPAASGGLNGLRVIVLDVPSDMYQSTEGDLHIDSADANFGDVYFDCVTWKDTPRCR